MIRKILPTPLDTKYNIIFSEEGSLAKAVASEVIGQNQITAWDIMIPLLFLYNLLKFKRAREAFALNFIFTKKLALEAALDMLKKGQTRQDALNQIEDKTSNILASDKKGIYADKIRQSQMKEIDLLIDHYCKLLNAEGDDYPSLVKNAYQTQNNYATFLHQLKQAEKEVNRAALQTVGKRRAAHEIVSTMEKATQRMRIAEAEKIFA